MTKVDNKSKFSLIKKANRIIWESTDTQEKTIMDNEWDLKRQANDDIIQNRCDKQLINVTDRTRGKITLKRNKLKVHTNKKWFCGEENATEKVNVIYMKKLVQAIINLYSTLVLN